MGTEAQAYADLVRTTMGTVNPVPAIVPVKLTVYNQSFTAFIGGAADKYPFIYGDVKLPGVGDSLGPTEIVGNYAKNFNTGNTKNLKQYYGYEEAYNNRKVTIPVASGKRNAFKDILEVYTKNPQTQINIIGHSLGGWNSSGLVTELNKAGVPVNLLITIDPVGVLLSKTTPPNILATPAVRAQIYLLAPQPVANNWINVFCKPNNNVVTDIKNTVKWEGYKPKWKGYHPSPTSYTTDDAIADAGGQWDSYPKEHSNTFHETKFSHAWFSKMMRETIPSISKSPEQILQAELKKVQVK